MTNDHSKIVDALPVVRASGEGAPEAPVDSDRTSPRPLSDEDSALALLQRHDLSPDVIEKLSKSGVTSKSRKVMLAVISHQKSPRYVSLSLMRKLFTFDLMLVALTPAVAGDLKMAAEELLINRLESISAGEKLSLAHRASGRVAGELLLDSEPRVIAAALQNARLTEAPVVKAVLANKASPALAQAVCEHVNWSLRREVRIALLRSEHTSPEHAFEFAKSLPNDVVKETLQNSRLPETLKLRLMKDDED